MSKPKQTTIADLTSDPQNVRRRTERGGVMLMRSLEEVGAARSIVIDEDGTVLCGNGVLEAAAQVGIEKVQIVEADGNTLIAVRRTGLTAEQKRNLAIFDNRTAELAVWDGAGLASLLNEGADLSAFWREDELAGLLTAEVAGLEKEEKKGGGGREITCPECGHKWEVLHGH
jgi:hypothetical protein